MSKQFTHLFICALRAAAQSVTRSGSIFLIGAFAALLVACGGGGGGGGGAGGGQASISTPLPERSVSLVTTTVSLPAANSRSGSFEDAEYRINWGLAAIGAAAAYERGSFGQGATVAVIDSGVRGSHDNLAGNILSAAARRFDSAGNAHTGGALEDPVRIFAGVATVGSHGTEAAGIIAGLRGNANENSDGSPFFGHGVAPRAKILPLRFSETQTRVINHPIQGPFTTFALRGDDAAAFRYAVANNVHIVNNSWGSGVAIVGHYGGNTSRTIAFSAPILPQVLQIPGVVNDIRGAINNYAAAARGRDVAVVWAAGNDGWNSRSGQVETVEWPNYEQFYIQPRPAGTYSPSDLVNNFVAVERIGGAFVSITLNRATTISVSGISVTVGAVETNGIGDYALAPLYHRELRGKWLAVVATDQSNNIVSFSNGCGSRGKYWCIAAPGIGITSAYALGDNWRTRTSGTSFSAPHVSGALALLKSRLPAMPMSVLVHILMNTATDLGASGVDDVYGHGLVNIPDAIAAQNDVEIIIPTAAGFGVSPSAARAELPAAFAGFAGKLNNARAAVRYLNGFYYDAPLGDFLKTKAAQSAPLDFAADVFDNAQRVGAGENDSGAFAFAKDGVLRSAGWQSGALQIRRNFNNRPALWQNGGDVSTRPFFAVGDGHSGEMLLNIGDNFRAFAARGKEQSARYRQFGLRWSHDFSRAGLAAAVSRISEDDTLLGGKFGGILPLRGGANARQTDIAGHWNLGASGVWRAFANYRHADIDANVGGIVGGMPELAAEKWQAGFAARDWLRADDAFRFGVGQDTAIRGGAMLRYGVSANPQLDNDTQVIRNRGYRVVERRVSLDEDAPLSFGVGYGYSPADNARLSFGANYRRDNDASFSVDWRVRF